MICFLTKAEFRLGPQFCGIADLEEDKAQLLASQFNQIL